MYPQPSSQTPSPIKGEGEFYYSLYYNLLKENILANIKEIFTSIQGEGPFIGYKQLFIRFCGCNLSCKYCDTDFSTQNSKEYSKDELIKICSKNSDCHSVSLTGGEPLLNKAFLKEFLPQCPLPVYLETNATLHNELSEIIKYITYISADIKLPSVTGLEPLWDKHDKFFCIGKEKILFAKIVFDENISNEEIKISSELCKKYGIELILQPKMNGKNLSVSSSYISRTMDKFLQHYSKVRIIPQTHKFIGLE